MCSRMWWCFALPIKSHSPFGIKLLMSPPLSSFRARSSCNWLLYNSAIPSHSAFEKFSDKVFGHPWYPYIFLLVGTSENHIWIFQRLIWIPEVTRCKKHMDTMGVQKTLSELLSWALCSSSSRSFFLLKAATIGTLELTFLLCILFKGNLKKK